MFEIIGAILFVAGIGGFMFAGALYFIRHSILGRYGCSTGWDGFLLPGVDARLFKQLAEAVDSEELGTVFRCINTLIAALLVGGAVLFFCGGVLHSIGRALMK
ncbi:MAG: hypothetical protein JSW59_18860 [Phycisphaerales bacterium]|nr:MAG: hypothetical protein JSW59_18860 [Phycisphaerales bacterium]